MRRPALILVEGESDRVALETLARRLRRDLVADGVSITPVGGAHAFGRALHRYGPTSGHRDVAGLCDAGEEGYVRRAIAAAGIGKPANRGEMEELGFFVCDRDLEDELIRAAGPETIEATLAEHGDLRSFRTMQRQPDWRDADFDAQARRFLGAGARRKERYAEHLVAATPLERMPRPLTSLLDRC